MMFLDNDILRKLKKIKSRIARNVALKKEARHYDCADLYREFFNTQVAIDVIEGGIKNNDLQYYLSNRLYGTRDLIYGSGGPWSFILKSVYKIE